MVIEPDTLNSCFAVPQDEKHKGVAVLWARLWSRFRMGCVSMPGGCKNRLKANKLSFWTVLRLWA